MTKYRKEVEYIDKKWDLETMKIKFKNLEKIIPLTTIITLLSISRTKAKSELDAYYLTYYKLKDMFLKYKRLSFGDTTKNVKETITFDWDEALKVIEDSILQTKGLSSNDTNTYINNSIYGSYNIYDSYMTNGVLADYDGRLIIDY